MRPTGLRPFAAAIVVALVALPASVSAASEPGPGSRDAAAGTAVTLITGDVAELRSTAGGAVVSVRSADGSATSRADFVDGAGHHHAWPTAVIPLIGDRLDSRLFDVSQLIELGLTDAAARDLPLLVEHDAGAELPAGMRLVESSPAAGVWRAAIDVSDRAALGAALRAAATGGDALSGIESIRLDVAAVAARQDGPPAAEHTLTVELTPYDAGADFAGMLWVEPIGRVEAYQYFPVDQDRSTVELAVEAGTYHLSFQSEQVVDGATALVDVSTNDLAVDGDLTVQLDGATADDIAVDVGQPVERRDGLIGGVLAPAPATNQLSYSMQVDGEDGLHLLVAPTEAPVGGEHDFVSIQTLLADGPTYHLVYVEPDGVPAGLTYAPKPADLAEVEHAMHADVSGRDYLVRSLGYLGGSETYLEGSTYAVPAGTRHTAWVTPDFWNFVVFAGGAEGVAGLLESVDEPWSAGAKTVLEWFSPVVRAGTTPNHFLAYQFDDYIGFDVSSFVDGSDDRSFYWYEPDSALDTTTYEVTVHGEVVLEGEGDLNAVNAPLPPDPAQVAVHLDVTRDAPWWLSSPATSTDWHFTSEPRVETFEPTYPAMLQVDYDVTTDLANRADAPATIGFSAYQPGEEPLGIPISAVTAWSSTDAGATWDELALERLGDGEYVGAVADDAACADPCRISLRTLAEDAAGNSVDQTVTDAFVLGGERPTVAPTPTASPTPTVAPTLPATGWDADSGALTVGALALLLGALLVGAAGRRLRDPVA